jgi:hypothetical protein
MLSFLTAEVEGLPHILDESQVAGDVLFANRQITTATE